MGGDEVGPALPVGVGGVAAGVDAGNQQRPADGYGEAVSLKRMGSVLRFWLKNTGE